MNKASSNFIDMKQGNVHALLHKDKSDTIAAALFDGEKCSPLNAAGRGVMMQFPWQEGRTGVLRVCRRGGLLGHFLKEGFLLSNRPLMEFTVHRAVLMRGVPAPVLLGVRWERRGLFYYGALATELLPGCDLNAWLKTNLNNAIQTEAILMDCGECIRQMHDRGVYHADLQLKNIFVADAGIFLLDFDRAQAHDNISLIARARNLLRLRRSFEKLDYPSDLWKCLLDGYGDVTFPFWLNMAYRVKAWF